MVGKTLIAAAVLAAAAWSNVAMAGTQVYRVSVACPGQPKFYDTIETFSGAIALDVMKRRYPGCLAYIETQAKRVSPQH